MNSLLAAGSWVMDVLFFVILFLGVFLGVRKGFIQGVCKLAGTFFSIFVAVTFCVSFQATLENSFGWTTALNTSIAPPFGQWIMVAICFIILLVFVKLGCWLVGLIGTALANRSKPLKIVNMVLGGILGAFKFFLIIFVILAIFRWIPSEGFHNWISSSGVVGKIFSSQWFIDATHMNFHL